MSDHLWKWKVSATSGEVCLNIPCCFRAPSVPLLSSSVPATSGVNQGPHAIAYLPGLLCHTPRPFVLQLPDQVTCGLLSILTSRFPASLARTVCTFPLGPVRLLCMKLLLRQHLKTWLRPVKPWIPRTVTSIRPVLYLSHHTTQHCHLI